MTRVWSLSGDRKFRLSNGVSPSPVATTPPNFNQTGTVTRVRGRSIFTNPVDPPSTFTWPPPDSTWATLPSQASVNYVDYYTPGDDMRAVLGKIQAYCVSLGTGSAGYRQVVLPNGFDQEFADFPMATTNKFGIYYDRLLGFIGPGEDNARIRLKRLSSTVGTGGTMMRLAGAGGVPLPGGVISLDYGYTLQGNRQADQTYTQVNGGAPTTGPQLYSGRVYYRNVGAITQRVRFQGTSCGQWNSPPGETFSINSYKNLNSIWRGVEVDGRDANGERWGGSPFGGNNSDGDLLEDCWMHHSYRSGFTHSFAGSDTNISAISKNVTTRRLRLEHNANIAPKVGGAAFTVINMENVGGTINHYNPYVSMDNIVSPSQWEWNNAHIAVNGKLFDNPDITITEPEWTPVHPRWSGCLVINRGELYGGVTNTQTTAPKVILDGVQATAIDWKLRTSATPPVVNPRTNYFWIFA